jgi:hypothetical protein
MFARGSVDQVSGVYDDVIDVDAELVEDETARCARTETVDSD